MRETERQAGGRVVSMLPWLVVGAAALGLGLPGLGREAVGDGAIRATLAVLVFAGGLGLGTDPTPVPRSSAPRLVTVWLVSTATLPVLAWASGRLVPAGELRNGVLAVGVAPTEVAVLALTSLAGGTVASAAVLLFASVLTSVLVAGPVLRVVTGDGGLDAAGVLVDLLVVVAVPLLLGLLVGRHRVGHRLRAVADPLAVVAVSVLVWMVALQVRWSGDYLRVAAALAAFTAGSVVLGALLARGGSNRSTPPILLSTSMRDFAIATGIASSAFGAASTGPLGVYGVLVLVWGTVAARGFARRTALPGRGGPTGAAGPAT